MLDERGGGRLERAQRRALDHPLRLQIVDLFRKDAERPLTATAVHNDLTRDERFRHVTVSQVNYHLARLRDAQLIPV